MLPDKIAFVDLETTGARWSDRIIEVGIIRVENNGQSPTSYKVVQTYQSLINPNCRVPEEIVELTGISPAQLENSPTFGQIKKDILELLEDCIFVAHNVRFDYSFLRNEFRREEISFRQKHFCTVKLSRRLFPEYPRHNLDSLIERFKFKVKNRHRALDDAKVLFEFWKLIQKKFSQEILLEALSKTLKKPSLPINLPPDILDNLPESPGVYIFYGENGMPLYVGKSINIRDRVLSHFSSDHLSSTEMKISQQIQHIEVIETAGELGALFKEAALVKKMQPLYNRKLRYSKLITIIKKEVTKDNYFTVKLTTADQVDPSELDQIYGTFKNVKSAKEYLTYLAKEHELCEKLLGVDPTNQACFGYRLGKCKGACQGKEMSVRYNLRFLEAFSKNKLKPWPFESPIIIEEKNELEQKSEAFLFDKWCYLGTINTNVILGSDTPPESALSKEFNFDLDTYKILARYLSQTKNMQNIKVLPKAFI